MLLLFATILTLQSPPSGASDGLRAMRALADQVTIETASTGALQRFERLSEPIYRFDDPARRFSTGTIWAWGRPGRPAALLTLAKEPVRTGGLQWLAELTSLAPGPIVASPPVDVRWQPAGAGVVMQKLPGAPDPGADAPKRLRQMKDLVRQIKAFEYWTPADQRERQRYELRVLPQPIHRYNDAKSGLIDGALFIISYGMNPELVLLLEDCRQGEAEPAWNYGLARISAAEVRVQLNGAEIYRHPGGFPTGPQDIYWTFTTPATAE